MHVCAKIEQLIIKMKVLSCVYAMQTEVKNAEAMEKPQPDIQESSSPPVKKLVDMPARQRSLTDGACLRTSNEQVAQKKEIRHLKLDQKVG